MAIKCPSCGHSFELSREPVGFEDFWSAYPRKVGKGQAKKAYVLALAKTDRDTLVNSARAYRALMLKRGTDITLQAHPSTFLAGERWLDDELKMSSPGQTNAAATGTNIGNLLDPSWGAYWPKLLSLIGFAMLNSWFVGSKIEGANPVKLVVSSTMKRDWINKHFARQLWDVFGEFQVIVKPDR